VAQTHTHTHTQQVTHSWPSGLACCLIAEATEPFKKMLRLRRCYAQLPRSCLQALQRAPNRWQLFTNSTSLQAHRVCAPFALSNPLLICTSLSSLAHAAFKALPKSPCGCSPTLIARSHQLLPLWELHAWLSICVVWMRQYLWVLPYHKHVVSVPSNRMRVYLHCVSAGKCAEWVSWYLMDVCAIMGTYKRCNFPHIGILL